jgi:HEAT repeat protein
MLNPNELEALSRQLQTGDPNERTVALRRLAASCDLQALPLLLGILNDSTHDYEKQEAINGLANLPGVFSAAALKNACYDEAHYVREAAAYALDSYGHQTVFEPFLEMIKNVSQKPLAPTVVSLVLNRLGEIGEQEAVPVLLEFLAEPSNKQRGDAAQALGKIGDPRALEALLTAAQDKDHYVRMLAVEALANFDDPRIAELQRKYKWHSVRRDVKEIARLAIDTPLLLVKVARDLWRERREKKEQKQKREQE